MVGTTLVPREISMAEKKTAQKAGRSKNKSAKYVGQNALRKNKLKRVLQSCSLADAKEYAAKYSLTSYLTALIAKTAK